MKQAKVFPAQVRWKTQKLSAETICKAKGRNLEASFGDCLAWVTASWLALIVQVHGPMVESESLLTFFYTSSPKQAGKTLV